MNELSTNVAIKAEYEFEFSQQDLVDFVQHLVLGEKSKNTIFSYKFSLKKYIEQFGCIISKLRMINYKNELISSKQAPKTINVRLQAMNTFIKFLFEVYEEPKLLKLVIKQSKIQNNSSVENVISTEDFNKLLTFVKASNTVRENEKWYLVIKTLGYTGVRVSELVKLEIDDLKKGDTFNIHSKGDKLRKVIVPKELKKELLDYAKKRNIQGVIFRNLLENKPMTTRGICHFLHDISKSAGVPKKYCHPHSFRHMFAINLLEATDNLSFVSDMLGHASINTTSIYLKMSLDKQKRIINEKVNW